MHRPEFILPPLALAALVHAFGCDPQIDPPDFRGGEGDAKLSYTDPVLDPVPGGGGCEGCVTCFAHLNKSTRQLCVRTDIRFTGYRISLADDLPLSFTGQTKWQLHDGSSNPLCSGDSCVATALPLLPGQQLKLDLTVSKASAPRTLRFTQIEGLKWRAMPEIRIAEDLGAIADQDPGSAEPVTDSDAITDAMVHITYPARSVGVSSCSGFLVADRLVLTAAHCLVEQPTVPTAKLPGWPGWTPVPAAGIDVRLGGLHGPDDLDGTTQKALAVHIYNDPEVDLALVELAVWPGVAPLVLSSPQLAPKPNEPSTIMTYGYGVSGSLPDADSESYDWGRLKRTLLEEEFLVRPSLENAAKVVTFAPPPGMGVCHGDSGGPVVRTVDGTSTVIGVMLARVVTVGGEVPQKEAIDLLGGAGFAFSRHNSCGLGSPLAYVAARLDRPEVRTWLDSFMPPKYGQDELPFDPFDPPAPTF